jgi:hypothetical protein
MCFLSFTESIKLVYILNFSKSVWDNAFKCQLYTFTYLHICVCKAVVFAASLYEKFIF